MLFNDLSFEDCIKQALVVLSIDAIDSFDLYLKYANKKKDVRKKEDLGVLDYLYGISYYKKKEYSNAYTFFLKAKDLLCNCSKAVDVYKYLGYTTFYMCQYEESISFFKIVENHLKNKKSNPISVIRNLYWLGLGYEKLGNDTDAYKYFLQTLETAEEYENKEWIARVYCKLSESNIYKKYPYLSIDNLLLAEQYANEASNDELLAVCVLKRCNIYLSMGNIDKAKEITNNYISYINNDLKA